MRLTLVAVGRGRGQPAQVLYEDYARQLTGRPLGPLTLKEVQERRALPAPELIAAEARLIRAASPSLIPNEGARVKSKRFSARRVPPPKYPNAQPREESPSRSAGGAISGRKEL